MRKKKKIKLAFAFAFVIMLSCSSCCSLRNPLINTDRFSDWVPWWHTNVVTNVVIEVSQ